MWDRLELPRGVRLTEAGLVDDVRGVTLPVNETGRALVGAASLDAMADRAVAWFAAPRERALSDARLFALELNRLYLLNVRVRGGPLVVAFRWLASALVLVRHGSLPRWPACRHPVDTTSSARAAATAGAAALKPGAAAAVLVVLAPLAVGLPFGLALPAAVAVAIGVAAHEGGHAVFLRGVPAFTGIRCARVAIVHRQLDRRRTAVVALGGPVAGSLYAGVLALAGWTWSSVELAAGATLVAPQALALTVFARDGRRACDVW